MRNKPKGWPISRDRLPLVRPPLAFQRPKQLAQVAHAAHCDYQPDQYKCEARHYKIQQPEHVPKIHVAVLVTSESSLFAIIRDATLPDSRQHARFRRRPSGSKSPES